MNGPTKYSGILSRDQVGFPFHMHYQKISLKLDFRKIFELAVTHSDIGQSQYQLLGRLRTVCFWGCQAS